VGARILVVEDEQIIAADLINELRRMGHEVVGTAIAGHDAIRIAEQAKPDLVLMDVQLEDGMTGMVAGRMIQERLGSKIIFLTAFPGVFLQDHNRISDPGICLGKPFSRIQLEAALSAALGSTKNVDPRDSR
jgi:two-component system cell cycle sensor histidine kinase/response regulator CckA